MNAEGITYLDAIDKLEELRLIMKRVHKKSDVPYRKAGFQAMILISEKNKVTMQELGEELRKKFWTLAPKGVEYLEEHRRKHEEWVESLWSKLDNKEKEAFNITLTKMSQILKEEVEEKEEE